MTANRPSVRTCGSCSFCCKVMSIDELDKPMGSWCVHRKGPSGCSIYGSHPHSCQVFACQWLLEPSMPHRFRPDQTKVVLTTDDDGPRLIANCDPSNALAWRREPIFTLLKRQAEATWASDATVIAKAGRRLWLITPTQELDLGEVDERAPMSILKARDGSASVTVLPPIPAADDVAEHLTKLRAAKPPVST